MLGQIWINRKRYATTGSMHSMAVRRTVSHTLGWFREFLAVPDGSVFVDTNVCIQKYTHTHTNVRRHDGRLNKVISNQYEV